jgi:predicted ATP-grasp superfamily ATP-dependent carboligase
MSTATSPWVLITNAEERAMLAACRTLRAAGYKVSGAAFTSLASTYASRDCSERLRITDPRQDAQRFVEDLRQVLTRRRYAVLLPGSDHALLAISRYRERLEGLTELGLPAAEVVERTLDREILAEAARDSGLIPTESIRCSTIEQARSAARELGLPALVKSARTAEQLGNTVISVASRRVNHEHELAEAVLEHRDAFLVQRMVSGELFSVSGVMAGGELLGFAMARHCRTWPVEAGNASFAETIAASEELKKKVQRLLSNVGCEGIFQLELIRSGGSFTPIDLNPRPYGSMGLAAAAGVPIAALWCDWVLGKHPRAVSARAGQHYRWVDAELRYSVWQIRHDHWRAAATILSPRRHVVHAHFQTRDPAPVLIRWLYLLWRQTRD